MKMYEFVGVNIGSLRVFSLEMSKYENRDRGNYFSFGKICTASLNAAPNKFYAIHTFL